MDPEGLGILDPVKRVAIGDGMLVVLDEVDMYIGGNMGGDGFSFGGSIAESVY